jgi:hypothetical protein
MEHNFHLINNSICMEPILGGGGTLSVEFLDYLCTTTSFRGAISEGILFFPTLLLPNFFNMHII